MSVFVGKCPYCGKSDNYEIGDGDWKLFMSDNGIILKCKCRFCLNLWTLSANEKEEVMSNGKTLD